MIICEAAISNLEALEILLFGCSVTDRFDTTMPGVPGKDTLKLSSPVLYHPPTQRTTHLSLERGNPPPLSITHTYKRETDIN